MVPTTQFLLEIELFYGLSALILGSEIFVAYYGTYIIPVKVYK
jgi:hypothetical protein